MQRSSTLVVWIGGRAGDKGSHPLPDCVGTLPQGRDKRKSLRRTSPRATQRKFASLFREERQKGKVYAVLPLERHKGSLLVHIFLFGNYNGKGGVVNLRECAKIRSRGAIIYEYFICCFSINWFWRFSFY